MAKHLEFAFDTRRIRWDPAEAAVRNDCSLCGVMTDEDEVPLRMWRERDGAAAVFCVACAETVFKWVDDA